MITRSIPHVVEYPETDGLPMGDNTLQIDWILRLVGGLKGLFRKHPDVFVAGNLLWYPVERDNKTVVAPDALVAFGRPKGYRSRYLQWEEGDVPPQVVFEVLSPSNSPQEMTKKREFYRRHGAEEYYLINPYEQTVEGWIREGDDLIAFDAQGGEISPRLGTHFAFRDEELVVLGPDGGTIEDYEKLVENYEKLVENNEKLVENNEKLVENNEKLVENNEKLTERVERSDRAARHESRRAREAERGRAEAKREADAAKRQATRLAEMLRALGVDPDA